MVCFSAITGIFTLSGFSPVGKKCGNVESLQWNPVW